MSKLNQMNFAGPGNELKLDLQARMVDREWKLVDLVSGQTVCLLNFAGANIKLGVEECSRLALQLTISDEACDAVTEKITEDACEVDAEMKVAMRDYRDPRERRQ